MSFKKKELDCSNDFDHDDIHHGNCMIVSLFKLGETKNDLGNLEEKVDDDRLVKIELATNSDPARPASELDRAATKLQKLYERYRTRRNLDDCAVVAEELWCNGIDFEALMRSSVSFFDSNQSETTVSRWARARVRAAKVGKGLSKNEKAQKLAQTFNWLEAIDPYHRYGHNLRKYYDIWLQSESIQPFFYWLDIGDGKELNLENCPRTKLQQQCVKYLGPEEREAYEVVMESGKLVYKQSRVCVDTSTDAEWIFVLSTSMNLYVGEKQRGHFQHSSFLSGAATIASGRLVAHNGILKAIWSSSGHYRPTEETLIEVCRFLDDHHVDLTNVKKSPFDEDNPPKHPDQKEPNSDPTTDDNTLQKTTSIPIEANIEAIEANVLEERNKTHTVGDSPFDEDDPPKHPDQKEPNSDPKTDDNTLQKATSIPIEGNIEAIEANVVEERNKTHMVGDHDHRQEEELQVYVGVGINNQPTMPCKWTTEAGPGIKCVEDYPTTLKCHA